MNFITILRILLFPFSVLYGIITSVRNFLFDLNILKSTKFDLPIITVGNLSVGGTGKTPQIEYLIRLLQNQYKISVLSRGYKRQSEGFVLADEQTSVEVLGDEPFQFHQKFPKVQVAVNGDRVEGVQKILKAKPNTEIVLLDDAYQHRKIKAGYQILLSTYADLFYKDFMLPTGNLRELWWGKKRANSIIVTKCPLDLSEEEQQKIVAKIKPAQNQQVYFTTIGYADGLKGSKEIPLSDLGNKKVVLVTGIAKPQPLLDYMTSKGVEFEHLKFPDHHNFTVAELKKIHKKSIQSKIVTTEKDFVRLEQELDELYYLPIETVFLNKAAQFDKEILAFVKQ